MDEMMSLVRAFNMERGWREKHKATQLAMSVAIEAAELLECFQWISEREVAEKIHNNVLFRERVSHEVADVMIYSLGLLDQCGIDPRMAIIEKLKINASKYPVD